MSLVGLVLPAILSDADHSVEDSGLFGFTANFFPAYHRGLHFEPRSQPLSHPLRSVCGCHAYEVVSMDQASDALFVVREHARIVPALSEAPLSHALFNLVLPIR